MQQWWVGLECQGMSSIQTVEVGEVEGGEGGAGSKKQGEVCAQWVVGPLMPVNELGMVEARPYYRRGHGESKV